MKLVSHSTHFMSNNLLVFFKQYWRLRRPSPNPKSIFVPNMFCVILCKFPNEFLCRCLCAHFIVFAEFFFWMISCLHVWSCKCGRGLVTCTGLRWGRCSPGMHGAGPRESKSLVFVLARPCMSASPWPLPRAPRPPVYRPCLSQPGPSSHDPCLSLSSTD